MIITKSEREINLMKVAGQVLVKVFDEIEKNIHAGMTTLEIDEIVERVIKENGCIAAEKGYCGFPASACVSVNDTLIHGIPSSKIRLQNGDIVSVDVVVTYQGYSADACRTFKVGTIREEAQKLIDVTKQSFFEGVKLIKPGVHLGDISEAIQKYVEMHGYNVVRDFTGHGIGKNMHEDPVIPNYGKKGTGPILVKGMTLAIEPMVLQGKKETRTLGDGWTVKSKDGKLTAHYENTVVVTEDGYEIITIKEGEQ